MVITCDPGESIFAVLSHQDTIRAANDFSVSVFVVLLGDIQQLLEVNNGLFQSSNSWDGEIYQDYGGTHVRERERETVVIMALRVLNIFQLVKSAIETNFLYMKMNEWPEK